MNPDTSNDPKYKTLMKFDVGLLLFLVLFLKAIEAITEIIANKLAICSSKIITLSDDISYES